MTPLRLAVALAVLTAALGALWKLAQPAPDPRPWETARRAWEGGRPDEAERAALEAISRQPDRTEALLVLAEVAFSRNQPADAIVWLRRIPASPGATNTSGDSAEAADGLSFARAGELALKLGHAAEAEGLLQVAVRQNVVGAETQLAHLLGLEGRTWEASEFLWQAIRNQNFVIDHLILLSASEPVIRDGELLQRCIEASPENPLPRMGEARTALSDKRYADAEPVFREVIRARPDLLAARAWLGHLLLNRSTGEATLPRDTDQEPIALPGPGAAWDEWLAGLPAAPSHPEVWFVVGRGMQLKRRLPQAIRAYLETLSLDPNHRPACYQLGLLFRQQGEEELAERFLTRADRLEELAFLVDRIHANRNSAAMAREAALLTERLARPWEAAAWAHIAQQLEPGSAEGRTIQVRTARRLQGDPPRTLPESLSLDRLDLARWPVLERLRGTSPDPTPPLLVNKTPPSAAAVDAPGPRPIRFRDVSRETGVDFTYDSGRLSPSATPRMGETLGGGAGAFDYDRDGRVDLFWTQGRPLDRSADTSPSSTRRDTLFRSRGERFTDVTTAALPLENDYGQGCAAGDLDNDGFPDLYVANLGRNRLLRNLGDGTFEDVTDEAGIAGEFWTSSTLIADLNGDGAPELFDCTYLDIRVAPMTLCVRGDEVHACGPAAFQAEQDRLHQNLGNGRFADITGSSGIPVPDGKGLGVIAADFAYAAEPMRGAERPAEAPFRRPNLFVANDAVPNFYFLNETSRPGDPPRFTEQALAMGLALNEEGLSTACMGVAAGDADGDGRLDLFITNYAQQANTLYRQAERGMFSDITQQTGLVEPSWNELGFGTQFLDADFDGRQDLVLTNGHVHDLSKTGEDFHMRPQFFRNEGGLRFRERFADELGEFFRGRYLGRGLARLDWNRDGREDFCVSHIDAPASLVSNETSARGHYLAIELSGTRCSRDAVATVVTVRAGERSWSRQLVAGDGFQASNEKLLIFWIGDVTSAEAVELDWPDGTLERHEAVATDRRYLAVEGQPVLWPLPGDPR